MLESWSSHPLCKSGHGPNPKATHGNVRRKKRNTNCRILPVRFQPRVCLVHDTLKHLCVNKNPIGLHCSTQLPEREKECSEVNFACRTVTKLNDAIDEYQLGAKTFAKV